MTLKALLARVPGARQHHVDHLKRKGALQPPPVKTVSGCRLYSPAHVAVLRDYVAQLEARNAMRERWRTAL